MARARLRHRPQLPFGTLGDNLKAGSHFVIYPAPPRFVHEPGGGATGHEAMPNARLPQQFCRSYQSRADSYIGKSPNGPAADVSSNSM
ncbi:hypothetical protein LTR09_009897 [Extremus antarcticus]|uniref:Uncharacterized protein n=1 Tax=Extremus antarcticus TaxID=702011 RepID=A0AAJ0G5X5_9PEZI|nr:hypothetical protein LTR09_009897 [Extremus antarcticus]